MRASIRGCDRVAPNAGFVRNVRRGWLLALVLAVAFGGGPTQAQVYPKPQTPEPSCVDANHEASVAHAAVPVYPDSARSLGLGPVTVVVSVVVSPAGGPESVTIATSSGNQAIDHAALEAARQSTYDPKVADCEATTGAVLFRAPFDPHASAGPASCANPNSEGHVVHGVEPIYPESARALHLGPMSTVLEVTIGADGRLVSSSIYKSSGNVDLDQSALAAARASTYTPKLVNCVPTAGTYLFKSTFTSNAPTPSPAP